MKAVLFVMGVLLMFQPGFSQKKVLVEILTNSHCPLCPSAYTTVNNYLKTDGNSEKIIPIFYHMPFPYSDDKLYQDNTTDAMARSSYYGITSSTPRGIFDGSLQSNSYANWATTLNTLSSAPPVLKFSISGKINGNSLEGSVNVERTGNYSQNDLNVFLVLVENVNYSGRNGISKHTNVVRRILNPNGSALNLAAIGEKTTITHSVTWDSKWIADSTSLVAFVQSKSEKTIFQAESIRFPYETGTSVTETNPEVPKKTGLLQNYPNPFNPSTKISWYLESPGPVAIKVFNLIGQQVDEILTVTNQPAGPGTVSWEANGLPSGVYLVRMETEGGISMIRSFLLK